MRRPATAPYLPPGRNKLQRQCSGTRLLACSEPEIVKKVNTHVENLIKDHARRAYGQICERDCQLCADDGRCRAVDRWCINRGGAVCLLRNTSTENFITADHPITNVHQSCDGDLSSPPEEADFYYPISPRYALMLNTSDRFQPGVSDVDAHFVQSMNLKISEGAEATIFGLSKEDIQPYRAILGQRLKRVKEHHRRR